MRFDKRASKKSKSGYTWRVTIEYKDQFGVTRKHTKSGFTTKNEAKAYGAQVQADLDAGLNVQSYDKTLDQVFEEWHNLTTLSPNSVITYSNAYRKHVSPVMGKARIKDLHYVELQSFFNQISGLGKSNVQTIRKVLRQIGKLAVKAGYISGWPLDQVEIKGEEKHREEAPQYLSHDDFTLLVNALNDGTFEGSSRAVFVYLGYYLGLRIAEALALHWTDFESDYSSVRIHSQLLYTSRKKEDYEITETMKSANSRSRLPAPSPLAQALHDWKRSNPHSLVVCREDGSLWQPQNFRKHIKEVASGLGIPFHPHMLRHTFVTNLILAGADPKTAAELARHSDPSLTLQIYTEISQGRKEEVIKAAFSPDEPNILA